MKPEEQRIAIAEWCGWSVSEDVDRFGNQFWKRGEEYRRVGEFPKSYQPLPDYLNDLNAIHEAEIKLPPTNGIAGRVAFDNVLMVICGSHQACISSTASQRAEALLRTIGKWTDTPTIDKESRRE